MKKIAEKLLELDTKPLHSRDKRAKRGESCLLNENEDQRLVNPRISVAGAVRIELTSKGSESFVLPLHYAPILVIKLTIRLARRLLGRQPLFWHLHRYG
ncbi:MAG: hypothetical protein WC292_06880 [Clostridia bacterium]